MNYLIEQCLFPIIEGDECVGQGFVALIVSLLQQHMW